MGAGYTQLKVWQLSMDLAQRIYRSTQCFPKYEVYGLSSQMQRAAVSIPSNIAEGHARESTKGGSREQGVGGRLALPLFS